MGEKGVSTITSAAAHAKVDLKKEMSVCGFSHGATECDLTGKDLGADDARLLAYDIQNGALKKLTLWGNDFGGVGVAKIILQAAEDCGRAVSLCGFDEKQTEADLKGKQLTRVEVMMLAFDLSKGYISQSLRALNLEGTELTNDKAMELAKGIRDIKAPLKISLFNNPLDDRGVKAITKAATGHDMSLCGFDPAQESADLSGEVTNRSLTMDEINLLAWYVC